MTHRGRCRLSPHDQLVTAAAVREEAASSPWASVNTELFPHRLFEGRWIRGKSIDQRRLVDQAFLAGRRRSEREDKNVSDTRDREPVAARRPIDIFLRDHVGSLQGPQLVRVEGGCATGQRGL